MRRWAAIVPLCSALLFVTACGDEEDQGDPAGEDAAGQDGGVGGDAGSLGGDGGGQPDGSAGGGDAGAPDASGEDASSEPSPGDLPVLPVGSNNLIIINVTNSTSTILENGTYQAPYQKGASQGSSVSFLDSSYIFSMMPTLQVQMTIKREMKAGSFSCETFTTLLVRFGKPPSGSNQLGATSCTVEYQYDADSKTYSGTIEAKLAGGLTEAGGDAEADMTARFTWTEG